MSESITIARPYARAFFALAGAGKDVLKIQQELLLLSTCLGEEKVKQVVSSYLVSPEEKANLFQQAFKDVLSEKTIRFLNVLAIAGRLGLLPEIYKLFLEYRREQEGAIAVEVESAYSFSDAQKARFDKSLSSFFGLKAESTYVENQDLIAGVVIKTRQCVIDNSIKAFLADLGGEIVAAV